MGSPRRGLAGADRLVGIKAILRLLKEHQITVARTTINSWRRKNTPSLKPPIALEIMGNHPVLTASSREMKVWIEKARHRGLFSRSLSNHATRQRRQDLIKKATQVAAALPAR